MRRGTHSFRLRRGGDAGFAAGGSVGCPTQGCNIASLTLRGSCFPEAAMNPTAAATTAPTGRPDLDRGLGPVGKIGFAATVVVSILYVAYSVYLDASAAHVQATAYLPFLLLFVALLIALGFEFVNGFHD